jgi:hypothetical protein
MLLKTKRNKGAKGYRKFHEQKKVKAIPVTGPEGP